MSLFKSVPDFDGIFLDRRWQQNAAIQTYMVSFPKIWKNKC